MRCGACGEENGERAVVCELCQAPLQTRATVASRTGQRPTPPIPRPPQAAPPVATNAQAPGGPDGPLAPARGAPGYMGPPRFHLPPPRPTRGPGVVTLLLALVALGLAGTAAFRYWGGPPAKERAAVPAQRVAASPARQSPPGEPARPSRREPVEQPASRAPASAPANQPIVEIKPSGPRTTRSVSSSWYEGADGLQRAKREQEYANAPMIIYFRVDWCPYCRRMDQDITASAVHQFLAEVVKVRINPESSPADAEVGRGLGVKGYPSVYVVPRPGATPEKVASLSRKENEPLELSVDKFVKSVKEAGIRQAQNRVAEGFNKLNTGDTAGARAELDRAIDMNPGNADAYFWRGQAETKAGELGKAVGDFKRALELAPDRKDAHLALANIYGGNRQYEQAIDHLSHVIRMDPNWRQGMVHVMRADAYRGKGDLDAAMIDYAEACRRGTAQACNVRR